MSIHETTKGYVLVSMIDIIDKDVLVEPINERLGVEALATLMINFDSDSIYGYDEMMDTLLRKCS